MLFLALPGRVTKIFSLLQFSRDFWQLVRPEKTVFRQKFSVNFRHLATSKLDK